MKQILINVSHSDTKVCIVEDGQLAEFWVERKNLSRLVGNIYKGKVSNVLPGMQAAFVNIGLERNAFLYAGDIPEDCEEIKELTEKKLNLKAGDQIMVQVTKDQFGMKGARITMNISIPGRLVVFMPQIDYVGISRKITDEAKREQLCSFVAEHKNKDCGFIIRTQAENCAQDELLQEMDELCARWTLIKDNFLRKKTLSIIYKDEDLAIRAVRDMLRSDVDSVIINNEKLYVEFLTAFSGLVSANKNLFQLDESNLLEKFKLQKQIDSLLERRVDLKNGANLVIDRTEALTVIDVNTGKYVGEKNLEDTVFETNKLAAGEIARQLRLRNIGGIVVVDFIDMQEQEHIDKVMEHFQTELDKDRTKTSLIGMSQLGLVELTRKKKRSMIEDVMLQTCPYCKGNGYVFSDEHVTSKIKAELDAVFGCAGNKAVILTVSTSVFNKIFSARLLEKECMNEWRDKRIYVIADNNMHIEHYEIEVINGAILSLPNSARLLY